MSHSDFDVVTGPSIPPRPVPPQQRPSPPSEAAAEPVVPNPTPIDTRHNGEERRH
jgi:hypothetical protein